MSPKCCSQNDRRSSSLTRLAVSVEWLLIGRVDGVLLAIFSFTGIILTLVKLTHLIERWANDMKPLFIIQRYKSKQALHPKGQSLLMCHVAGGINQAVNTATQQRFFGLLPVKGKVAFAGLYRQLKRATLIEAIVTGVVKRESGRIPDACLHFSPTRHGNQAVAAI